MHAIYLKVQRIFNNSISLTDGQIARSIAIFCAAHACFAPSIDRGRAALCRHDPGPIALVGELMMGIIQDHRSRNHRRHAEECIAMARAADDQSDKVLWLTLAQSWVRLAEHVARAASSVAANDDSQGPPETAERSTA
jgi:hypothetical protein